MASQLDLGTRQPLLPLGSDFRVAFYDAAKLDRYKDAVLSVLERTGVSFCTRLHFGHALDGESEYYLRLAYSGVSTAQIQEGLGSLKALIESYN